MTYISLLGFFKVVFKFTKFQSIVEVDSALSKVPSIGGTCTAGVALSKCHMEFFADSARGRSRALLVLMAGTSTDDVSNAAASLRMCGVKITVVGIGKSVQHLQLTKMAYPSSSVLRTASFDGLFDISGSTSSLIQQGKVLMLRIMLFIIWTGVFY